ncbi:hypothetical protein, partial [Pedobacter fastidiosus]|uniref:hypothetical protein n=1 Tax=Pedobacter fastidiosus TaxID=2765361 RepID=UPI001C9A5B9F
DVRRIIDYQSARISLICGKLTLLQTVKKEGLFAFERDYIVNKGVFVIARYEAIYYARQIASCLAMTSF